MKSFFSRKDFPSLFLLVSFLIYSAITKNVSLAHSIIVLCLSSIYCYHQYLINKEQPNYDQKINEVRKEASDQISKLRDEFAKYQMSGAKPFIQNKKVSF